VNDPVTDFLKVPGVIVAISWLVVVLAVLLIMAMFALFLRIFYLVVDRFHGRSKIP
jgi:hypothetical protein